MSLALIAAFLLMQTGPLVPDGAAPSLGLPMIDRPPPRARRNPFLLPSEQGAVENNKLAQCRDLATGNPDEGVSMATDWLSDAKGPERAQAHLCLGYAYTQAQAWAMAEQAFLAGRDEATDNVLTRARLGTMAANAALAADGAGRALVALDRAQADAKSSGDAAMIGAVATDRARTLVALKRNDEAAAALAEARKATPTDATPWLLSATLSRRMNHLAEAQGQIETAAKLSPLDPEVGLEAGVIAELSGHEDAARRSWQSVVTASPQSDAGHQAAAYLAQIGPAPTSPAPTGAAPANAPSTTGAPGANAAPSKPLAGNG
jgi:tetratricopeptide (TPR) repeat protein